ncbi:hypothetical protein F443_00271 [Phytophthora nicotianae P1569]|uniref:Uncharacterized protein n=1 Tax=Phytophthora nicotianae P1569 TaxID=1317065 RepID=V9G2M9_PHYNI|nr:hypothetical protein F443_00271 [Phytophthora nicotianae P1569]
MPRTLLDTSYSEEMNIVLGMTTRCVASAIEGEYKVAVAKEYQDRYTFEDDGVSVRVRSQFREYLLQKEGWSSDCETLAQTMKLAYRHAMAFKKDIGSAFIIPFSAIQPRWFSQSRICIEDTAELATPFVAKIFKTETDDSERPLSEKEKYRAMSQFDTWWHDMRHGNVSMTNKKKDTSDGKEDDNEDDSGAAGGSVGGSTPSPKAGVNEGLQDY